MICFEIATKNCFILPFIYELLKDIRVCTTAMVNDKIRRPEYLFVMHQKWCSFYSEVKVRNEKYALGPHLYIDVVSVGKLVSCDTFESFMQNSKVV